MKRPRLALGVVKRLGTSLALAAGLWAAWPIPASAAPIVLDPGPGTDYLGIWCGGQQVNEIASGFDAAANPTALVKVTTTCHGSGRGSPNQYYLACWTVTFSRAGAILSKEWLATNHWVQGHPAVPCPVAADPAAVFTDTDGAGQFPATLSTATTGAYRAVLDATCAAIGYGNTTSGRIDGAGLESCHSWDAGVGDGVRIGVAGTSGTLVPALEVRRRDGSVLCGAASGAVDCAVDASGLHTIVVQDAAGAGTGDFDLTLTCLTASCGAVTPAHLAIDLAAGATSGRFLRTLTYTITASNDGGSPASDVAVLDSLPQPLFVRSVATTQGSCTHSGRDVRCALGTVAPGSSVVATITAVTLLSSGQITNTACLDGGDCATAVTTLP